MNNITNPLQVRIMRIVDEWIRAEKQPIPKQHIVVSLVEKEEYPPTTVKAALRTLCSKGYLRKTVQQSAYVQLRSL